MQFFDWRKTLYRAMKMLPWILIIVFVSWGLFYTRYIRVDRDIREFLKKGDRHSLEKVLQDKNRNWYQKSMALEYLARLKCPSRDANLSAFLNGDNISFRQAVVKGCIQRAYSESSWILHRSLVDEYSYIKFLSLKFIQKHEKSLAWTPQIQRLQSDSSSMVRKLAQEVIPKGAKAVK